MGIAMWFLQLQLLSPILKPELTGIGDLGANRIRAFGAK
jgi:hypothetical protein